MTDTDSSVLTDERLAALAAELTAAVLADPPPFGAWARPPLADTGADQHDTIGNPYWRVIRQVPTQVGDILGGIPGGVPGADADDRSYRPRPTTTWPFAPTAITDRVHAAGLDRNALSRRYSWSIPSPGDIAWIGALAADRGVVELGAGGGYWAAMMRAAAIDVLAYEPRPVSGGNGFANRAHTAVEPGDDTIAARHPDRALFLCWPSNGEPWAARAVRQYRGDLLIHAGQDAGGCTADDEFFELLDQGWEPVGESPHHVAYFGVPCRLTAWRR